MTLPVLTVFLPAVPSPVIALDRQVSSRGTDVVIGDNVVVVADDIRSVRGRGAEEDISARCAFRDRRRTQDVAVRDDVILRAVGSRAA